MRTTRQFMQENSEYRPPVNLNNMKPLTGELLVSALKSVYQGPGNGQAPNKERMSAGKRKYGTGNDRPKVARFRGAAYIYRNGKSICVAEYPSYDSYNRFQDKVKTVVHDEKLGLEKKLIDCCMKQIRKRSYNAMVIYANFECMPQTSDHEKYNYMINVLKWKKDHSDIYWKYPWKKLVFVNGTLHKEQTLAANPGFNIAGYPCTAESHNQTKLL